MKKILETDRLILQEFSPDDVKFILELVNSPGWLQFIGDRNIKTSAQAEEYLSNGPIKSYQQNGFGLWKAKLKTDNTPVGMCGLLKREKPSYIDIGFAMLPQFSALGYGFEAASATMKYAKHTLKIEKVVATTDPNNIASIRLLNKLGLRFEKTISSPGEDPVLFLSPPENQSDKEAIDQLTSRFFDLFTNTNGISPKVHEVEKLFIPDGIIINNTTGVPEVYSLKEFITPREEMLTNGTLTDFSEWEVSNQTEIYGNVAQRFCLYSKSGVLKGQSFATTGVKTIQFVRVNREWKISSIAWSDEN